MSTTKELRKGADGEAVVRLQQQLMDYGYYRDVLDGDFGPNTEAAVKAFQAAYDLGDTGVVDAETAGALGIEDLVDSFFDGIGWGDGIQDEWPTADELVELCLAQAGDEYEFGEKVDLDDADPAVFDCAELVEWAVAQLGLREHLDKRWDWSQGQRAAVNQAGLGRSVAAARYIRGALLFNSHHVAISLGTGNETIEAKGEAYGVGRFTIDGRFDAGGLVPGVQYPDGS